MAKSGTKSTASEESREKSTSKDSATVELSTRSHESSEPATGKSDKKKEKITKFMEKKNKTRKPLKDQCELFSIEDKHPKRSRCAKKCGKSWPSLKNASGKMQWSPILLGICVAMHIYIACFTLGRIFQNEMEAFNLTYLPFTIANIASIFWMAQAIYTRSKMSLHYGCLVECTCACVALVVVFVYSGIAAFKVPELIEGLRAGVYTVVACICGIYVVLHAQMAIKREEKENQSPCCVELPCSCRPSAECDFIPEKKYHRRSSLSPVTTASTQFSCNEKREQVANDQCSASPHPKREMPLNREVPPPYPGNQESPPSVPNRGQMSYHSFVRALPVYQSSTESQSADSLNQGCAQNPDYGTHNPGLGTQNTIPASQFASPSQPATAQGSFVVNSITGRATRL